MSASGQGRTLTILGTTSALPPQADKLEKKQTSQSRMSNYGVTADVIRDLPELRLIANIGHWHFIDRTAIWHLDAVGREPSTALEADNWLDKKIRRFPRGRLRREIHFGQGESLVGTSTTMASTGVRGSILFAFRSFSSAESIMDRTVFAGKPNRYILPKRLDLGGSP